MDTWSLWVCSSKQQRSNPAWSLWVLLKHYSLCDKISEERQAELKNLKLVIIDEISMVKVDMLYMLDVKNIKN